MIEFLRGLTGALTLLFAFFGAVCFVTADQVDLSLEQRERAWRACLVCAAGATVFGILMLRLARQPTVVPLIGARAAAYRASPPGQPWVVSRSVWRVRRR